MGPKSPASAVEKQCSQFSFLLKYNLREMLVFLYCLNLTIDSTFDREISQFKFKAP